MLFEVATFLKCDYEKRACRFPIFVFTTELVECM